MAIQSLVCVRHLSVLFTDIHPNLVSPQLCEHVFNQVGRDVYELDRVGETEAEDAVPLAGGKMQAPSPRAFLKVVLPELGSIEVVLLKVQKFLLISAISRPSYTWIRFCVGSPSMFSLVRNKSLAQTNISSPNSFFRPTRRFSGVQSNIGLLRLFHLFASQYYSLHCKRVTLEVTFPLNRNRARLRKTL